MTMKIAFLEIIDFNFYFFKTHFVLHLTVYLFYIYFNKRKYFNLCFCVLIRFHIKFYPLMVALGLKGSNL